MTSRPATGSWVYIVKAFGPTSEQSTLLGDRRRGSGESRAWGCEWSSRTGRRHDLLRASPPEELEAGAEPPTPVGGLGVEERIDVPGLHCRPVRLGGLADNEDGEIPDGAESAFDRGVGVDVGASAPGPLPGTHQMLTERPPVEATVGPVDATLPAPGGERRRLGRGERRNLRGCERTRRPIDPAALMVRARLEGDGNT
jgi:hypothetical protein